MLQCVSPGAIHQSSSPYELLISRIFRQVNSSAAQSRRQTIIVRQPEESADDWDSFLEQLDVEESVRVIRIEHGTARLKWTNQHLS